MIKYYFEGAFAPSVATDGASGLDLCVQKIVDDNVLHTGVHVEIPVGFTGLLVPRSSWGDRGWRLKNTVGIIDSDYRGEIIIHATKDAVVGFSSIRPGDRVCQLVVVRACSEYTPVKSLGDLSETTRGTGGFGSTGAR